MSVATDGKGLPAGGSEAVNRAHVAKDAWRRRILTSPQLSLASLIVVFGVYVAFQNPNFITFANGVNIARDGSFMFIIAIATTYVLIAGGIDLSVGSVFALSSVSGALLAASGTPVPVAFLAGVAVGGACGVINAVVVEFGRIPSLIVTLGMFYVARGLVWVMSGGSGTAYLPDEFGAIASTELVGIPLVVYYAAILGIVAHVVLERTPFGYGVRATGGNRASAVACGVNVRRTMIAVFTFSGLAAGLSGVLTASLLQSGQPSVGMGLELQIITAAIIGGTSLFGGVGSISGTLLGTLLIAVLGNGLVMLRIDPLWQNVVIGVMLVAAVGLDQLRRANMWQSGFERGQVSDD